MTSYTSNHSLPKPDSNDLIAAISDNLRIDIGNLAEATDRELDAGAAVTKSLADLTGARTNSINKLIGDLTERSMDSATASGYAVVFSDEDGRLAGGVTTDGVSDWAKPVTVAGATGVMAQPIDDEEWAYVHTDAAGYVAFGIKSDGSIVAPKGALDAESVANIGVGMSRSKRDSLAAVGDSLTAGFFGGNAGPQEDSWPAKFALLAPAVTVSNIATSGLTVDEESINIGALELPLTVTGGSIPASGGVTVSTSVVVGWRSTDRVISFNGSLNGVAGSLSRASDGTLTFTRTTSGSSVPVIAGTVFVPNNAGHDADTTVIMIGRNNVTYNVQGADTSIAQHVVNGIRRIVEWHSRQLKQVLVMSVTTMVTEPSGSAGHTTVKAINDALQAEYSTRYYDLRHYLVNQAIYDLGITPTSTDLSTMATDTLPPSIMDPGTGSGDNTHYSKATAALVAQQVYERITQRDWIKE